MGNFSCALICKRLVHNRSEFNGTFSTLCRDFKKLQFSLISLSQVKYYVLENAITHV